MIVNKRPNDINRRPIGNLPISQKLSLSFLLVVGLPLIVIVLSLLASLQATTIIKRTNESLLPSALTSSYAQVNLLHMVSSLRSYLVLGDAQSIENYHQAEAGFIQNLADLQTLSTNFKLKDREQVAKLQTLFNSWLSYPERLIALHDDQMEREPAYSLLNTRGTQLGGQVLIETNELIGALAAQEPSEQNNTYLRDVAKFQTSFIAMFSGLRGYVTTRNPNFRYYEYENNLAINTEVWQELLKQSPWLTDSQRSLLNSIDTNRSNFLKEIPESVFSTMSGTQWRLDLALFSEEATPLTDEMDKVLQDITLTQQEQLKVDLNDGATRLEAARLQQIVSAVGAILLSIVFALFFRQTIVKPIVQLTQVADSIRNGDLHVLARVETKDEIGTLATTFNNMTGQLRSTLQQVKKEKQRADSLLDVVIPIGVALASEKEFNRLLENILVEAKSFCKANAGILYLLTDDQELRYVIAHNDVRNIFLGGTSGNAITHPAIPLYDSASQLPNECNVVAAAALHGTSINIPTLHQAANFDSSKDVEITAGYSSLLLIPLKESSGKSIGMLQLLDAQDAQTGAIIPFDANLQQMMETFSTLAVAALTAYIREQSLRSEITKLRIEIDHAKRQQQVEAIVETDFFQNLRSKAKTIRGRDRNSP